MSTYRSLLRHSAAYSVPVILSKMLGFMLLPVYTRYLSTSDYGILELLDLTSFVLSSLVGARLSDALFYFYSDAKTAEERDSAVGTAFLTAMIMGALGSLAGYLLTGPLGTAVFSTTAYSRYFHLVVANFLLMVPGEIGLAYIRVQNRSGLFASLLLGRMVVAGVLNVALLAVWSLGISAMLWSTVIASAVLALVASIFVFANVRVRFNPRLSWRMIAYAFPPGVAGVAMLAIHYGDRFFLQRWASLSDVGIYSLAYKMGMLVSYVQVPFATYWTSQMYRIVRGADGETVQVRVCTYLMLALTSVAVVMTLFSKPALQVLATPAYRTAVQFIPFIAAAYVIRGIGEQFRSVFFTENRTHLEMQATALGSGLCLAAYALLIPAFKMWGAVAATSLTFVVMTAFSYWKAQRVRKYHYETKRMWKIALSACAACAVPMAADPATMARQLGLSLLGLLLFPVFLLVSGFFTQEEIGRAKEVRNYLRLRGAKLVGAA